MLIGGDAQLGLLYATLLMFTNLILGFFGSIITQTMILSAIAGGGALLEVGVLLVLGACLMSRQPLDDKKRFENNGTPTKFWTVALIGRRLLIASFILFIYMILVTIAGLIIGF